VVRVTDNSAQYHTIKLGASEIYEQTGTVMPKASIASKDHYARLSYLYQLSMVMSNSQQSMPLSRFYGSTVKAVARKNVLRLSPDFKRTMCRKCNRVLNPETSARRIINNSNSKDERNDVLEILCECGWIKRYPVGRDAHYELWSDKVESTKVE
jgi:ribonuclease P protein subunit RPR2